MPAEDIWQGASTSTIPTEYRLVNKQKIRIKVVQEKHKNQYGNKKVVIVNIMIQNLINRAENFRIGHIQSWLISISTVDTFDACLIRPFFALFGHHYFVSTNVLSLSARQKLKNFSSSDWKFGFTQTTLWLVKF